MSTSGTLGPVPTEIADLCSREVNRLRSVKSQGVSHESVARSETGCDEFYWRIACSGEKSGESRCRHQCRSQPSVCIARGMAKGDIHRDCELVRVFGVQARTRMHRPWGGRSRRPLGPLKEARGDARRSIEAGGSGCSRSSCGARPGPLPEDLLRQATRPWRWIACS